MKKIVDIDNYGKPRSNYTDSLATMTDVQLFDETKSKIWLSAYADNNPRSDYHWHVDSIYDEWKRREKTDEYGRAHKQVRAELS